MTSSNRPAPVRVQPFTGVRRLGCRLYECISVHDCIGFVVGADADELDAALDELWTAVSYSPVWPAVDPTGPDRELEDRNFLPAVSARGWLRRCVDWLVQLDTDHCLLAVALRPATD
jgi:hypothetical protein